MKQKVIANMCSFVGKVWCIPLPLFIVTHPPGHQLLVVFLPSHPTTTPPSPKICYHFDVLLKEIYQRKFKFVGRIKEIDSMHFQAILL